MSLFGAIGATGGCDKPIDSTYNTMSSPDEKVFVLRSSYTPYPPMDYGTANKSKADAVSFGAIIAMSILNRKDDSGFESNYP